MFRYISSFILKIMMENHKILHAHECRDATRELNLKENCANRPLKEACSEQ
jgi:hypothetical protein